MFDHHRKSPWFAEKYDPAPEFEKLRDRVRKEGWKGRLNTFLHDLDSGKFDPDLIMPEQEPPSPVKENPSNSDETAADDRKAADDEMQFNMDAEDDAGDPDPRGDTNGKALGKRGISKDEEASALPEGNQVMIRTIPPDIGRVKLEEVGNKLLKSLLQRPCRHAERFRTLCILLWVIPFKNVTFIEQVGSVLRIMLTWDQLRMSCQAKRYYFVFCNAKLV